MIQKFWPEFRSQNKANKGTYLYTPMTSVTIDRYLDVLKTNVRDRDISRDKEAKKKR